MTDFELKAPGRAGGMGAHHSALSITETWLTPPELIKALGPFDLDPCAAAGQPWPTAGCHFTHAGLDQCWVGRVWLNPPYGKKTGDWLEKLAQHGNGIALIFARTETDMFHRFVWQRADAVFFFRGRLTFCLIDGTMPKHNSGAPSVLVAYGKNNILALSNLPNDGKLVMLR